jgi:hypothetical protein
MLTGVQAARKKHTAFGALSARSDFKPSLVGTLRAF